MIAVLTYDAPHRKTQDLLMRLAALGQKHLFVVATPWEERKNFMPMIPHRPSEPNWPCSAINVHPAMMCKNLGYQYQVLTKENLAGLFQQVSPEMVLIGGAGILPANVIKSSLVVNSHPAMLPHTRGLDALKWAIYNNLPVGVTLHIIDEHPDAGFLIKQEEVPLYHSDTFHSFAMRQYEMEIGLLAESPDLLRAMLGNGPELESRLSPDSDAYAVHKRMPHLKEMIMLRRFERRRDES
jgi:phosphoribosylglycinamide formyltransferase-1